MQVENLPQDYPFLSSPLQDKGDCVTKKLLCSSPILTIGNRMFNDASPSKRKTNPIRIGSKSDLISSETNRNEGLGKKTKLQSGTIRHKDQAVAHVLLSVSSEWDSDIFSFFHVCLRTLLNEAGIAYRIVPMASIVPFKAILHRHMDKYSEHERSAIKIDLSCRKCREGMDGLLLDAGASFLFMTVNEFLEMDITALIESITTINGQHLCPPHRRINLVLMPRGQPKKRANEVVFPELKDSHDRGQIQNKILELQLNGICQVFDWRWGLVPSLGTMIIELLRTVAFEPFRTKSLGDVLSNVGKKGREQKEVLRKMLLLINGVSESIANAIVHQWPSLGALVHHLRELEKKEGFFRASLALANIEVYRPKSTKNIGNTLSQRIFAILMGMDPEVKFP